MFHYFRNEAQTWFAYEFKTMGEQTRIVEKHCSSLCLNVGCIMPIYMQEHVLTASWNEIHTQIKCFSK